MTRGLTVFALVLLGACASQTPAPEVASPDPVLAAEQDWPPPVGQVALVEAPVSDEAGALDVDLVVFDPGIPEDVSTHGTRGIYPLIRKAESRFMPVMLRQSLVASGAWGVVRVLPESDASAELQVQGKILHSDGERLALQITAVDATGRVWLDAVYTDVTSAADYPVQQGADPFADIYRRIANDLLAARQQLNSEELVEIRRVANLRYASALAPEAFADYVAQGSDGRYRAVRLPAADDPMLVRIGRIRDQEHLFIDTVDEQYLDLLDEMRPTYNLWRQYGREQAIYITDYQDRLKDRDRAGRRGSFAAMKQTYDTFKWSKMQQQEMEQLAGGFNNEVTPTVLEVNGRIFRLSGSLDSRYDEWRGILREIFQLETGAVGDGAQ